MAQLTIGADKFNLNATWTCRVVYLYNSTGSFNSSTATQTSYSPGEKVVGFTDERLVGVTVKSVKVHASYGTGLLGGNFKIDGVSPDSEGFVTLISPDFSDNTINVTFSWNANTDSSSAHSSEYPTYNGSDSQTVYKEHTSSSVVENVYIVVDYEPDYTPPTLIDYTDPVIVQGETYVKAVHMTELHTNVNLTRGAYNLGEYAFTDIIPLETMLSGWNDHVMEIRSAIDETGVSHETWIQINAETIRQITVNTGETRWGMQYTQPAVYSIKASGEVTSTDYIYARVLDNTGEVVGATMYIADGTRLRNHVVTLESGQTLIVWCARDVAKEAAKESFVRTQTKVIFGENYPRLDVLLQLRRVVAEVAKV